MLNNRSSLAYTNLAVVAFIATHAQAEEPNDAVAAQFAVPADGQRMLQLPVRVVDPDGAPVSEAKVTPWALRSSHGHGLWREGDEPAGVGPKQVFTDENGNASVLYPLYRDVQERTHTMAVSLFVDHPHFAYVDRLHVNVPLEADGSYEIELTRGCPLEVRPLMNGEPVDLDGLFAVWSDGRSWQPGVRPEKLEGGDLRIPAMRPGANSLLLAKLDDERATHFSELIDFHLEPGDAKRIDVPLRPALKIEGSLSDNVPRPVRRGRIKVWNLPRGRMDIRRVQWFTWVSIRPDGTFTIDGWPAGEPLQVIALCDGFIATSGDSPAGAVNVHPREDDPFQRPQVFEVGQGDRIELAMEPLVPCTITAVDQDERPIVGVTIASWPNVCWWNGGSQIYCHPLVRGERLLDTRDYQAAADEVFPQPFQGETDFDGKVTLELPAGAEKLAVSSDVYELPVVDDRRNAQVELIPGEVTETVLRLQPRGVDQLGEWEEFAKVALDCSIREFQRIRAMPGVREQMDDLLKRFRKENNQPTPKLASEACTVVADAFLAAGDNKEAAEWNAKAAEQALRANEAQPAAADE